MLEKYFSKNVSRFPQKYLAAVSNIDNNKKCLMQYADLINMYQISI